MLGHYGATRLACFVVAVFLVGEGVGGHVGDATFKERGAQHVLVQSSTAYLSAGRNNSANGIMGYGGALTLVNGSPFEWKLSSETSYQMDTWKWPNVAAGKSEETTFDCIA